MIMAKSCLPADLVCYHLWQTGWRPLSYLMWMRSLLVGKMAELGGSISDIKRYLGLLMVLCGLPNIQITVILFTPIGVKTA